LFLYFIKIKIFCYVCNHIHIKIKGLQIICNPYIYFTNSIPEAVCYIKLPYLSVIFNLILLGPGLFGFIANILLLILSNFSKWLYVS
jgi:hypothetical protein